MAYRNGALEEGMSRFSTHLLVEPPPVPVVVRNCETGKICIMLKGGDRKNRKAIIIMAEANGVIAQTLDFNDFTKTFAIIMDYNVKEAARKLANGLCVKLSGITDRAKLLLEEIMKNYVLNDKDMTVIGKFASQKDMEAAGVKGIVINSIKELEKLSVAQLTLAHNNLVAPEDHIKKFPDVKTGAKKVMELLDAKDVNANIPKAAKAGKAEKTGGTKKASEPKPPKFADDMTIIKFPKNFNAGSLREQAAGIIPAKGLSIKKYFEKCVSDLGFDEKQGRMVLEKLVAVNAVRVVKKDDVEKALAESQKAYDAEKAKPAPEPKKKVEAPEPAKKTPPPTKGSSKTKAEPEAAKPAAKGKAAAATKAGAAKSK